MKALEDDYAYYHTPCRELPLVSFDPPLTYAAKAWLGMTVNHGVKNQMDGERKKKVKDFVNDVHAVGWSAFTLDRAVIAWRRLGNDFMPTQGHLNNARKEARQESALNVYSELRKDIFKISGVRPVLKKPSETQAERDAMAESVKLVRKLRRAKELGYSVKANGEHRTWLRADETVLAGLEYKLERAGVSA